MELMECVMAKGPADDEYRLTPWMRPGWTAKCPWPRQTPMDYRQDRTWYPVLCQMRSERRAADWLIRSGYRPYWPHTVSHRHQKNGKQVPIPVSVISGMLFVPMPAGEETFDHVRSLPGVIDFIEISGEPQALTDWQINRIREIEGALNTPPGSKTKIPDWCVKGKRVKLKVVGDEHWDLVGPIISVASSGKIIVEAKMLGCRRPMTVPVSQIEPI